MSQGIKMKIELRLYASLSRVAAGVKKSGGVLEVEVKEGTTIWELLKEHEVSVEKVKLIFLNGKKEAGEKRLSDGDRLGVFPPVAGG